MTSSPSPRPFALLLASLAAGAALSAAAGERPAGRELARARTAGRIELVATFDGPMPTGVTVSHKGRIFVNFPRWGDRVDFTVAELRKGKAVAYPDEAINSTSTASRCCCASPSLTSAG